MFICKWDVYSIPPPRRAWGASRMKGQKGRKSQRMGRTLGVGGWQGCDTHELSTVVVVFPGIAQDQTGQSSTMAKDRAPKALHPVEVLQGVHGCWQVSSGVWLLKCCSCPSGCLYIHMSMRNKSLKSVKARPREACHSRGEWMERQTWKELGVASGLGWVTRENLALRFMKLSNLKSLLENSRDCVNRTLM